MVIDIIITIDFKVINTIIITIDFKVINIIIIADFKVIIATNCCFIFINFIKVNYIIIPIDFKVINTTITYFIRASYFIITTN
jgi:hypothetical protein